MNQVGHHGRDDQQKTKGQLPGRPEAKTNFTLGITTKPPKGNLQRTTFETSRLLDFCSEKELTAQTGHDMDEWPLVILKELLDNGLDACEEAGIPPKIKIAVDARGITVSDKGPGMMRDTIERLLNYSVKVSSREAYVAPDRGAQGNALQTIFAMPFVVDGKEGHVAVVSGGHRHEIRFAVDQIRRQPVISHTPRPARNVKSGTRTTVFWAYMLTHYCPVISRIMSTGYSTWCCRFDSLGL